MKTIRFTAGFFQKSLRIAADAGVIRFFAGMKNCSSRLPFQKFMKKYFIIE